MSFRPEGKAHLHWASTNHEQPCFCNPVIYVDLVKLTTTTQSLITPETIAAIFGVRHPEQIHLQHEQELEPLVVVPSNSHGPRGWKLKPDQHYQVHVVHHDDDDDKSSEEEQDIVPIHGIFALFQGDSDDEKSDRLQHLSETFYDTIWNDPETPPAFRTLFFSLSSSAHIQAFRQFDWFHEVFGGPSMSSSASRRDLLLPKVMAKHTSSRMTRDHALTWLQIMKRSVELEFPNQTKLQSSLGLYWLHFFGFFPYTDEDRKEFRRSVFGTN